MRHSKTQDTHAKSDHSNRMSFTTHLHHATQPHSSKNLHQLEVSRYTHHFSAICSTNLGIC